MKNEKLVWLFVGNALAMYAILVALLAPFCAELLTNVHAVRFSCSDRYILQTLGGAYGLVWLPIGGGGLVVALLAAASRAHLRLKPPAREAGVCLLVGLVVVGNQLLNASRLYCVADTHRQVAELIKVDPQDLSDSKYSTESSNWREPIRVKASTVHKNPCQVALGLMAEERYQFLVPNKKPQPSKADCDSIVAGQRMVLIGPRDHRSLVRIDLKTGSVQIEVDWQNDRKYERYDVGTYASCQERWVSGLDGGCEVGR